MKNYNDVKNDFKNQVIEQIVSFSKTDSNKDIYAIAFDCDDEVGQVCLRYNNLENFEKQKKDWDEYSYMFEPYGLNGLFGLKYSVGDFEFIECEWSGELDSFFDSYYFYSVGDYYGEGEPIDCICIDGNELTDDDLADSYYEIWKRLILETINEIKDEVRNVLNVTDDFIMFMCMHDISNEDFKNWVEKTTDCEIVEYLASIID